MKKRMLMAAGLALALVLSAAGCGKKKEEPKTQPMTVESTVETSSETSEVLPEERLSDHAYYYSRELGTVWYPGMKILYRPYRTDSSSSGICGTAACMARQALTLSKPAARTRSRRAWTPWLKRSRSTST